MSRSLGQACSLLVLTAVTALGGPFDELRSLSHLSAVDPAALKNGQIVVERRPNGEFVRGICLEACYFIRAPMKVVGDALLHWDPLRHHDLDVTLYHEYSLPPAADAFKTLQLNPRISDYRWLIDQTAKVALGEGPAGLHLTNQEMDSIRQQNASASASWQEILRARSEALARGGLAAVPPFGPDRSISPIAEFSQLLALAPKAARNFRSVARAQPFAARGKPASEAVGYWEATKLRDHTTLQLGLFAAQKSPESWQLIDCVYYPSDTYFMALDLFQLWPVDGGTLVWQVGFASAPFRSYLGGFDRYIAGKLMTQETIGTIKAFRADVEK